MNTPALRHRLLEMAKKIPTFISGFDKFVDHLPLLPEAVEVVGHMVQLEED